MSVHVDCGPNGPSSVARTRIVYWGVRSKSSALPFKLVTICPVFLLTSKRLAPLPPSMYNNTLSLSSSENDNGSPTFFPVSEFSTMNLVCFGKRGGSFSSSTTIRASLKPTAPALSVAAMIKRYGRRNWDPPSASTHAASTTSRLRVPWQGSPPYAAFVADNVHLFLPIHACCTTIALVFEWHVLRARDSETAQVPTGVPYDAKVISETTIPVGQDTTVSCEYDFSEAKHIWAEASTEAPSMPIDPSATGSTPHEEASTNPLLEEVDAPMEATSQPTLQLAIETTLESYLTSHLSLHWFLKGSWRRANALISTAQCASWTAIPWRRHTRLSPARTATTLPVSAWMRDFVSNMPFELRAVKVKSPQRGCEVGVDNWRPVNAMSELSGILKSMWPRLMFSTISKLMSSICNHAPSPPTLKIKSAPDSASKYSVTTLDMAAPSAVAGKGPYTYDADPLATGPLER